MMRKFISPAKLNLGLWILGKRPDGYHEIFTIYQAISLWDEIYVKEGPLKVETSIGIPQEENLVYKALMELQKVTGKEIEVSVYIQKRIPVGGGLGGGSSNVATVLKAVNQLLGLSLSQEELAYVAGKVSSDAPFFLWGGSAIGEGRGEKITPVELPHAVFTVIYPGVSVSTRWVYRHVGQEELTDRVDSDKIISLLKEGRWEVLENALGRLAARLVPAVGEVVRFLEDLGYRGLVSGSGACVFYVGRLDERVREGAHLRGWRVFEVESLGCSSTGRAPDFGSGGSWFESRHPSFPLL